MRTLWRAAVVGVLLALVIQVRSLTLKLQNVTTLRDGVQSLAEATLDIVDICTALRERIEALEKAKGLDRKKIENVPDRTQKWDWDAWSLTVYGCAYSDCRCFHDKNLPCLVRVSQ